MLEEIVKSRLIFFFHAQHCAARTSQLDIEVKIRLSGGAWLVVVRSPEGRLMVVVKQRDSDPCNICLLKQAKS